MILMPQIFDVTANEKARYKRNELESYMNGMVKFLVLFTIQFSYLKKNHTSNKDSLFSLQQIRYHSLNLHVYPMQS